LQAGVKNAEVLIANDYEVGLLCSKTGTPDEELKKNVPIVITTLGKEGSLIEGSEVGKPMRIKVAKPKEVLDPTGAGDAFRAGFLHGYVRKWDLKTCAQLGSVVASFVIEQHGGQVALSQDDIVARYKQTYKEEIEL
jgi:adenosine kinase